MKRIAHWYRSLGQRFAQQFDIEPEIVDEIGQYVFLLVVISLSLITIGTLTH